MATETDQIRPGLTLIPLLVLSLLAGCASAGGTMRAGDAVASGAVEKPAAAEDGDMTPSSGSVAGRKRGCIGRARRRAIVPRWRCSPRPPRRVAREISNRQPRPWSGRSGLPPMTPSCGWRWPGCVCNRVRSNRRLSWPGVPRVLRRPGRLHLLRPWICNSRRAWATSDDRVCQRNAPMCLPVSLPLSPPVSAPEGRA